jgi:hypothetical protein
MHIPQDDCVDFNKYILIQPHKSRAVIRLERSAPANRMIMSDYRGTLSQAAAITKIDTAPISSVYFGFVAYEHVLAYSHTQYTVAEHGQFADQFSDGILGSVDVHSHPARLSFYAASREDGRLTAISS